jgi:hypothetical protein
MKKGNWVPMDKALVKTMSNINRPFSPVEAMFSYSVDRDNGKEGTLRGYAKLWGWSVGKVKRFVECLRNTSETVVERKGNGSGTVVRFVHGGYTPLAEQLRNSSGTVDEHKQYPTINPNPNPKKDTPFRALNFLTDLGVEKQKAKDFLKNRKTKRLANTLTAFNTLQKEIAKTGLTPNEIIHKCCDEGWGGFKASWLPESKIDYQIEKERKALGIQ